MTSATGAERARLEAADTRGVPWRRWGPYLSERQWGTVREDVSTSGDAWASFTHDQARSRAYRWGEDGLAGLSDDRQLLCLALALWNGREYAKAAPDDVLMQVTVHNRGPKDAEIHVLPTLWFRHTWSWADGSERPALHAVEESGRTAVVAEHRELGTRWLYAESDVPALVTGNETNNERVFGSPNETPYVKDGVDRAVVHAERSAVDPSGVGTKAALHHRMVVPAHGSFVVRIRLTDAAPAGSPFDRFDDVLRVRREEADQYWGDMLGGAAKDQDLVISRQALSGVLWSKQYYAFDVERWLAERGADPLAAPTELRNGEWRHLVADDIIAMPDKWEYPWFAAWDLAFHAVALAPVDVTCAKQQVDLLLNGRYLHPNGQLPAYEWNFSDVNPPVHAWATLPVYEIEKLMTGRADRVFLERAFHKLLRNFGWWLNRKDADNRNIFQGGFLGLDNIGVFDRSAALPTGGHIDQADGTAWMALYCQHMGAIALELARTNPVYVEQAQALLENFAWIAAAINHIGPGGTSLWDEEDGFFYDVLRLPDGGSVPLKVRSIVGLLPLAASTVKPADVRAEFPELARGAAEFLARHPALTAALWGRGRQVHETGPVLAALFDETRLRRILARMLDEAEFLGPYGIRSLSRWHADHPYVLNLDGQEYRVAYLPAESDSGMFGGNSNWRGPVWFPINVMLIRALLNLHGYFGDGFTVECPTGSGRQCTLYEVANELSERLMSTFRTDCEGRRPVHGGQPVLQTDPHWRDLVLFYEYFHGDNGAGIGASHQTGWTGMVGLLPLLSRRAGARP
jgi:hypothetical protein